MVVQVLARGNCLPVARYAIRVSRLVDGNAFPVLGKGECFVYPELSLDFPGIDLSLPPMGHAAGILKTQLIGCEDAILVDKGGLALS